MKFHNQRSFMGHEISNVNNKPLLRKRGKQWIVVAVSALILAGFGGMVSTTTHADTTVAPTTTKVSPKPVNDSTDALNVMKQAQGMHKALANNAAVQKPSVPSSTAPASIASTSSAKSGNVSASSSADSKASSSVNSASAKSSVASTSNSNSSNNKATKPAVHMLGMGAPVLTSNPVNQGTWGFNDSAHWIFNNGTLTISDGQMPGSLPLQFQGSNKDKITAIVTKGGNVTLQNSGELNTWDGGASSAILAYLPKVQTIDLSGMKPNYQVTAWGHGFCRDPELKYVNLGKPDTSNCGVLDTLFTNDGKLQKIDGMQNVTVSPSVSNLTSMFQGCSSLQSLDLSGFNTTGLVNKYATDFGNGNSWGTSTSNIFTGDTNLSSLHLGPNTEFKQDSGISPYAFTPGTNIATTNPTKLDDGQPHMGNWNIYQHGKWGTSEWYLNNGTLLITDGTLTTNNNTNNLLAGTHMTSDQAKSVNNIEFTSDVIAPNSNSNSRLFDDEGGHAFDNLRTINVSGLKTRNVHNFLAMFCGLKGLQHIYHLSDLDMSNASDERWMFGYDSDLQDLDLSQIKNPRFNNDGALLVNDNNLNTLVIGPNIQLGSNTQVPHSTWINKPEYNSKKDISQLTSGTWRALVTDTIKYVPEYSDISKQGPIIPCNPNNSPNNSSDASIYRNTNNVFQPTGILGTSDAINAPTTKNGKTPTLTPSPINGHWYDYEYNLMPGDWNIRTEKGIPDFIFNGSTHYIAIAPNSTSETIDYKYNNTLVSSKSFGPGSTADIPYASGVSGTSFNASADVPSGYHFSGVSNFGYDGTTSTANIEPNKLNDTIYYVVSNNTDYAKHGSLASTQNIRFNDYRATSAGDNSGVITSENNTHVPSGYHMAPSVTFIGTTNASNANINSTVSIAPDTEFLNVNYMSGNSLVSKSVYTGFMDNSATISAPANYKINSGQSSNFTYGPYNDSNSTSSVQVTPNNVNETINYEYQGHKEGTSTVNGPYNSSSEITSANANNINPGWHLASNSNSFTFNNDSVNVNVSPNTINDTIKYQVSSSANVKFAKAGQVLRTETSKFNDSRANVAGNTSAVINSANNEYVPNGYHMISNNVTIGNKITNSSDIIDIVPNSESEKINYVYNNNISKPISSSTINGGYYDNSSSVASNTIPEGWQFAANPNNSFTFGYNGNTNNVNIAPKHVSDMVNYQYNGKTINSYKFGGNDYRATQAGNNSFDVTKTNEPNIPAGYHLINENNKFNYDGNQNDNVAIVPNHVSDTVNYQYNDKIINSYKFSGNDYRAISADNNTFSINNNIAPGLPSGYHIVFDVTKTFNFNGKTYYIKIMPNVDTDTVAYQANGKTLANQQFTGNDEHATQAGDNSFDVTAKNDSNIPSGYELVNSDNTFKFDNGTHNVAIQPIPQSAPFIPMATSSSSAPVTTVATPTSKAPTESQPTSHYRYAKVVTPLQLHTSKHFTDKNGVLTIKHPTSFKIMNIVHDHKLTRYEVKYQGHNYFITANDHFTINNYVQKHDFKSHKDMMVRVIKPMIEYRRLHFGKKYVVRNVRKGTILPVKKVFTIGKGEMTRFELTNGRFVTSNKLFVKVIK